MANYYRFSEMVWLLLSGFWNCLHLANTWLQIYAFKSDSIEGVESIGGFGSWNKLHCVLSLEERLAV